MDLYIVRHGRPLRQVVGDDEGGADPDLSELGHRQAQRAGEYLQHEGIDHIVASTMRRAHQTAQPLVDLLGLEPELMVDLIESDHRSKAYIPAEEMSPDDPESAHYFHGNLHDIVFSDGYDAFEERVRRGFQHIVDTNRSKKVAVFCHGMVTAVFVKTIIGLDDVFSISVDYCGITRVQASSNGHRTVRSVNETHHVRDLIEW